MKLSGQHTGRKTPPTETVSPSGIDNKDKGEKRQTVEPERLGESQKQQQTEKTVAKTVTPGVINQTQPNILRKSYAQVTREQPTRSSSEKPWTEVKYANKKQGASQAQAKKQEPGSRRILFPRKEAQPKKSEEDIMLALNEALQKAGEPASIRFSGVRYSRSGAISALLTEKANAIELL